MANFGATRAGVCNRVISCLVELQMGLWHCCLVSGGLIRFRGLGES